MLALLLIVVAASAARADDFDVYHPDEHYRRLGLRAWDSGHRDMAVRYLTHAARYADKASQLALALRIYLEGTRARRPTGRAPMPGPTSPRSAAIPNSSRCASACGRRWMSPSSSVPARSARSSCPELRRRRGETTP
jgi:hypothetical protein